MVEGVEARAKGMRAEDADPGVVDDKAKVAEKLRGCMREDNCPSGAAGV